MADTRYTDYLDKQYSQPTATQEYKPPTTQSGKSIYDIQRERVDADAARQRKAREEALRRRMSQQGLADSGIAEKGQRNLDVELAKARATARTDIDLSEAQAAEQDRIRQEVQQYQTGERLGSQAFQADQTRGQYDFQTGERVGTQEWQAEQAALGREHELAMQEEQLGVSYAELGFREKQLAEEARQFDNKAEFDRYAFEQGITQQEADRAWQAEQGRLDRELKSELTYADLSIRESQLAQQADQFDNELEFKRWAEQAQYDEAEIQRAWQAEQNQKIREFEASQTERAAQLEEQRMLVARDIEYALNQQNFSHAADLAEQQRKFERDQHFDEYKYENLLLDKKLRQQQNEFDQSIGLERDKLAQDMAITQAEITAREDFARLEATLGRDEAFDQYKYQSLLMDKEIEQKQRELESAEGLERERLENEIYQAQKERDARYDLAESEHIWKQNSDYNAYTYERGILQMQLDEKAREFDISSGIEKDRLTQEMEMLQKELDSKDSLLTKQINAETELTKLKTDELARLEEMKTDTLADRMILEDELRKQAEFDKTINDTWYNKGLTGEAVNMSGTQADVDRLESEIQELDRYRTLEWLVSDATRADENPWAVEEHAALQQKYGDYDQLNASALINQKIDEKNLIAEWATLPASAKAAYNLGVSGASLQEYEQEQAAQTSYLNARIENLSELSGGAFQTSLNDIYRDLGYDVGFNDAGVGIDPATTMDTSNIVQALGDFGTGWTPQDEAVINNFGPVLAQLRSTTNDAHRTDWINHYIDQGDAVSLNGVSSENANTLIGKVALAGSGSYYISGYNPTANSLLMVQFADPYGNPMDLTPEVRELRY